MFAFPEINSLQNTRAKSTSAVFRLLLRKLFIRMYDYEKIKGPCGWNKQFEI